MRPKKRGTVLAESLSVRVADSMLAEDLLRLKNMVDELSRLEDIEYAFILNSHNQVMAHSFAKGFSHPIAHSQHAPAKRGGVHKIIRYRRATYLRFRGACDHCGQ